MPEINPATIAAAGPSIANAASPDLKQIITMQALAQRMQLVQSELQGQNALRALYSNPQNLHPVTGEPTPQAMNQLMQVAPQTGLDFQGTILQNRERQQRAALVGTKVRDDNRTWALQTVAEPSVARYREMLSATGSKDAAQAEAQKVFSDNREKAMADGRLSPDERQMLPTTFNLSQSEANLLGLKGVLEEQRKNQAAARQDRGEARQERAEGRQEDVATSTIEHQRAMEEQGRYQVKEDPNTGRPYMINTKTGDTKPVAPPGGQPDTGDPTTELRGEEFLKTLDPARAAQVKALADGRMPFPSGAALRSGPNRLLLQQVAQYDPEFNAMDYTSRAKTRNDFTSGKSAQNITAINTTIGHFGSLLKAGDALNNIGESIIPGVQSANAIKNWVNANRGDPRVVEFEAAKDAVTRELTRVFRGSSGNVADIKDWEKTISQAMSPEQLHSGISKGVELLSSRLDAMQDQYKRGMGSSKDVTELLSPKAKETLALLPGGDQIAPNPISDRKDVAAPIAKAAIPKGGGLEVTEEEYNKLPSGAAYRVPGNPKVMFKP